MSGGGGRDGSDVGGDADITGATSQGKAPRARAGKARHGETVTKKIRNGYQEKINPVPSGAC